MNRPAWGYRPRLGRAGLCLAVAAMAAVAATLGVFARGDGAVVTVTSVRGEVYDVATSGVYAWNAQRVVAEGVGWDIVTLLLAVPLLGLSVPLVARGSFRGRLFAAGMLGYFLYTYFEYAVTWAFGPLFLLFVAIYGASLVGIGWLGWSLVADRASAPTWTRFPRRAWAALNLTMASLLAILWLQRIAAALAGQTGLLLGETTMTVQALDLGLMLPACVLSSILVLRRSAFGYAFAAVFGVAFVAMATAIVGMLVSAAMVEGAIEIVPIVIFGAAALSALAVLVRIYGRPRVMSDGRPAVAAPRATVLDAR